MTSEDRRRERRERREYKRKVKKNAFLEQYNHFEIITNIDNLKDAFTKSKRNVGWKESVQRFELYLLSNLCEIAYKLNNGINVSKGFVEFLLFERGKIRHIKSVHISERVVQKCLCDKVLVPLISPSLIYDNGASMKNKGITFAMNRVRCHLSRFYRKNGNNKGYVLVIDFAKYFDNIRHNILFSMIEEKLTDEKIMQLYKSFVSVFGDNLSLGLGSQVSQISAIYYPNKIDHFIKEILRIKYYARYMDDSYLIHESKEYLEYCLEKIEVICATLGIKLNKKKTMIVPLSEGFWFLRGKYILLSTGKIICKAKRDSIIRMKRKLRSFKKMYDEGKMDKSDIYASYQSFRAHLLMFDSYYLVQNIDRYYKNLFSAKIKQEGGSNGKRYYKKCILGDKRRCSRASHQFIRYAAN